MLALSQGTEHDRDRTYGEARLRSAEPVWRFRFQRIHMDNRRMLRCAGSGIVEPDYAPPSLA